LKLHFVELFLQILNHRVLLQRLLEVPQSHVHQIVLQLHIPAHLDLHPQQPLKLIGLLLPFFSSFLYESVTFFHLLIRLGQLQRLLIEQHM